MLKKIFIIVVSVFLLSGCFKDNLGAEFDMNDLKKE